MALHDLDQRFVRGELEEGPLCIRSRVGMLLPTSLHWMPVQQPLVRLRSLIPADACNERGLCCLLLFLDTIRPLSGAPGEVWES